MIWPYHKILAYGFVPLGKGKGGGLNYFKPPDLSKFIGPILLDDLLFPFQTTDVDQSDRERPVGF